MPANEIHQNDVGTIFKVTVKDGDSAVDISSATSGSSKIIIFKKPSGTKEEKNASFNTDGTDGIMNYTIQTDDLDEIGTYQIQGKVVISDGTFFTDIKKFKVHRNL
tara:strand:+ start:606 stop:923 length:318 start_codon:yes stop_codon:yes gene_type:complete